MQNSKRLIVIAGGMLLLAALAAMLLVWRGSSGWRRDFDTASRGWEEEIFPWFGAETPQLVVFEYLDYDCPYCITSHRKVRQLMSGHLDKVRLVRLNYARMPCVPNDSQLQLATCELVRASICASRFVDFWEWNDLLIRSPRTGNASHLVDYVSLMRDQLHLPRSEFDSCLLAPETIATAQRIYEAVRAKGVRAVPVYQIQGTTVSLAELASRINSL